MKAIRITRPGGPEVLELAEVPDPEPARGEVLIRVRAAGLNRADLLQRRGLYPAPPGAPADIPGLEFAGEIAAVGPGVGEGIEDRDGWRVGDRVMGLLAGGGCAELVCVYASTLLPVPPRLSDVEAGAIPEVFLTAADALLERAGLSPGETVLIHSAGGGVGTAALQLAALAEAGAIIGTASAPKLTAIREASLPLDLGIDYTEGSFRDQVLERTGGSGVDVILDTVGATYWEDNLASLAPLGRLVIVGLMGGSETRVELRSLMRKRLTVVGTVLRARSVEEKARLTDDFRRRFLHAFGAAEDASPGGSRNESRRESRHGSPRGSPRGSRRGGLRPVLDRVFPLARAAEAHSYMESNRNFGKIVLEVG